MTDNLLKHLDEIKALHEAATEGPWMLGEKPFTPTNPHPRVVMQVDSTKSNGEIYVADMDVHHDEMEVANGTFIAHSRADVPRMERLIRAQQRVIEAQELMLDGGNDSIAAQHATRVQLKEAESALAQLIEKEWS